MTQDQINMFLMSKGECFDSAQLATVKKELENVPDDMAAAVLGAELKNPTTALIISFLGGVVGIDRFYIGQTGKGVAKLLTGGGCGIWALIDLFLISGATREANLQKFITLIGSLKR